MNPKKKLDSIKEKVQALRAGLEVLIKNVPQNQNITPAGAGFVMSSRHLSRDLNFSPAYYDFKEQHKMLLKVIRLTPIDKLDERIKTILSKRNIEGQVLHPEVIKGVRRIWLQEDVT